MHDVSTAPLGMHCTGTWDVSIYNGSTHICYTRTEIAYPIRRNHVRIKFTWKKPLRKHSKLCKAIRNNKELIYEPIHTTVNPISISELRSLMKIKQHLKSTEFQGNFKQDSFHRRILGSNNIGFKNFNNKGR